jgi:hypothetical protein
MSENLNLNLTNRIDVDNVVYNVNAVEAEHVQNALTINIANGADTTIKYNGENAEKFSVVPASGGNFDGLITVPSINQDADADGITLLAELADNSEAVLNYGDLSKIVSHISGAGWYEWDGTELSTVYRGGIAQHVGIVTGKKADAVSFASKNYANKINKKEHLPLYIYLSDTGFMFYGNCDSSDVHEITVHAASQLVDGSGNYYNYSELTDSLSDLTDRLDNEEKAREDAINKLRDILTKIVLSPDDNDSIESSDQITMTGARNDVDGLGIHLNYYRTDPRYTSERNVIYIRPAGSDPAVIDNNSRVAKNGDIWIAY